MVRIHLVDAFAEAPFRGNPAAVCILPRAAPERWMQDVAMEMNLSETAFAHREGNGWRLRWFTPSKEVDLCGHATLATAHVLWTQHKETEPLSFETLSGTLRARREGDLIELDFPASPLTPVATPAGLEKALGARVLGVTRTRTDLLAELESAEAVRALRPDIQALAAFDPHGVIVTAATPGGYACRYFAPTWGIDEDPATGAIQCALAPFWSARTGAAAFDVEQASRRVGRLRVRLDASRVRIAGRAFTTLDGEFAPNPA